MRDTFLFDLDGTLLPFDIDEFIQIYFREMGKHFHDMIDGELLAEYIMTSTEAMIKNLEPLSNEEKFMLHFSKLVGEDDLAVYKSRFDQFYDDKFDLVRECVVHVPEIVESIEVLKDKGYELVVATNPIFPVKAIHKRIEWAGLDIDDFSYISCYEKNTFCKPNIQFYQEVLDAIGKGPENCYMVGNDVQEDLIAGELGIETYLITDYLIDRNNGDIESTYKGNYQDFYEFVKGLEAIA
ncbi:MAG: HAD family hydrolase [Caldicoprobacterales bacterium]|jgi:FMN phosphatase YigB (HAD superfamily)|nr:HAD family hydrolase [Clostridiales bacterium]